MDRRKLAAALLVCLCFGSIHAYGVLLAPVEHWLGTSRTVASLGYAIAIAALTAGVYLNGRIAARIGPAARLLACGSGAALGLILAGGASHVGGLLIGFGVMFGLANGVAYALSLGLAAAAMPGRPAQAMGLATAAYGLGAVLAAQLFEAMLGRLHVALILLALAPIILVSCAAAAALAAPSPLVEEGPAGSSTGPVPRALLALWFSYLLGAFAGLMVLAHAPAIAAWREGTATHAGLVSGAVSAGSVAGGYLGGVAAAWLPGPRGIAWPMIVQALVLASLPFVTGLAAVAVVLGLAGLCYGVLIAVIPAEVRRIAGPQAFSASYGRVFSAWGIAGVAGPVAAGALFDATSGYGTALAAAAAVSLCSSLFITMRGA